MIQCYDRALRETSAMRDNHEDMVGILIKSFQRTTCVPITALADL